MSQFRENLQRLQRAAAEFICQREPAEARAAEVNPIIRRLANAGLADQGQQVTGPIIECWAHGESDSATYSAAAIQVPEGIGVVRFEVPFGEQPDEATIRHFIPFDSCEPSVQAKLGPHIDNLVVEIIRVLRIPDTNN